MQGAIRRKPLNLAIVLLVVALAAILVATVAAKHKSSSSTAHSSVAQVARDLGFGGTHGQVLQDLSANASQRADYEVLYQSPQTPACTYALNKLLAAGYKVEGGEPIHPKTCLVGNDKTPHRQQHDSVYVDKNGVRTVVRWTPNTIIISSS